VPEILEFLTPFLQAAPQPFVKDLAKFLRARNSAKSEFLAPLQSVEPQHFVKDLAEFRRPAPENFVQGRKFWPYGRISGPESKFLAL
jgi:hypothetical protein